jgi:uncharacterized membrane protein
MKKFEKIFLTGLFTLLPLGVTLWVLNLLFKFTDSLGRLVSMHLFNFRIPGLGLILALLGVLLIGFFAQWVFGKRIILWFEKFILKIPFINSIYNAIKGVTHSFSKNKENGFDSVVLVNFPNDKSKSIGLITNDNINFEKENLVAVFIPTTPNPTNGFLIFVKPSDFQVLDMSIDDAIKATISMGSVIPNPIKYKCQKK